MLHNKKLINDASNVVNEALLGLVRTHSHLRLLRIESLSQKSSNVFQVVVRSDIQEIRHKQVTLLSGGGSGHEPAHVGYVGKGMLSAAICGAVFTSPDVSSILSTIRACSVPVTDDNKKSVGVLLIVKNYTGDRLNFGLAMELARKEGYNVNMVIVGDDCALNELNPDNSFEYRRGIAGTCFVHKLVGAYAEEGHSLDDVASFANTVSRLVSTIGVGLSPCVIPGSQEPGFDLPADKIELGLGIHGEAGIKQSPLLHANETVDLMLEYIKQDINPEDNESIVLMVNNLGSTTGLEMYIVASRAIQVLEQKWNVKVERVFVGPFMTALEMAGVSLSVLRLREDKDKLLSLLDSQTGATAWPIESSKVIQSRLDESNVYLNISEHEDNQVNDREIGYPVSDRAIHIVNMLCNKAIEKEEEFSSLDKLVGDGDMGHSFKRGAELVLEALETDKNATRSFSDLLSTVAIAIRRMGGSSGVLLAIFFLRMSKAFEKKQSKSFMDIWTEALKSGIDGISELGGAKKGDRTMLDTLIPVHEFLLNSNLSQSEELDPVVAEQLVLHANQASEATRNMEGKKGRSGYLKSRVIGNIDPGAYAIAILLETMISNLK